MLRFWARIVKKKPFWHKASLSQGKFLKENVSLQVLLNFSVHLLQERNYAFLIMIFDTQTIQQKQKGSILKFLLNVLKKKLKISHSWSLKVSKMTSLTCKFAIQRKSQKRFFFWVYLPKSNFNWLLINQNNYHLIWDFGLDNDHFWQY